MQRFQRPDPDEDRQPITNAEPTKHEGTFLLGARQFPEVPK